MCFTCHGGVKPSGFATAPVDIRSFVTSTGPSSGHRVKTAGGLLPVGAPLPCYECHNPHGSKRGNDSMISDVRGGSLTTTGSADAVRGFCFTCHVTSDTSKGWDSSAATYTPVAAGDKVVGLVRTGGVLRLPALDAHTQAGATSCYVCHGSDYTAGGNNVHSPGAGAYDAALHRSGTSMCFGSGCHAVSRELPDVHAEFVGNPAAKYPQYATTCDLCHDNDDPGRIDFSSATSSCDSCHPAYHGAPVGQPKPHQDRTSLHTPTAASDACTGCHDASLPEIHGAPDYAQTDCGGCHATHPQANAACDICHASTVVWSKTADCAGCHSMTSPHPNLEASHTATMTSGVMNVFVDHDGGGSVDWDVECSMCHASTQLLTIHDNDCAACHSGSAPADSLGTWNKSCQQGACHPTVEHSLGDGAHTQIASQNCETCHESNWDVYYSTCEWCHDPAGATAPTTTSDLKPTYVGSATINFSAGGVHYTRYKLDGGAATAGSSLTVDGPSVGSASHVIEYWSVNDAGAEELPHKTGAFTIDLDTIPPVTTSNIVAATDLRWSPSLHAHRYRRALQRRRHVVAA